MGYIYLLAASILVYAAAGAVVALGQAKTSSFFLVGSISFCIGAYSCAILLTNGITEVVVIAFVAMAIAAVVGALLAVMTSFHDKKVLDIVAIAMLLAIGAIVRSWYNPDYPSGSLPSLTNGTFGYSIADQFTVFGINLPKGRLDGLFIALVTFALTLFALKRLNDSNFGTLLSAVDDNRLQAALDGYRVTRLHIWLGAVCGALIALSGVAYFATYRFVDPSIWTIEIAIGVCLIPMVFPIGAYWRRALIGAALFVTLPELLRAVSIGAPLETYVRNIAFLALALIAGIPRQFAFVRPSGEEVREHFR